MTVWQFLIGCIAMVVMIDLFLIRPLKRQVDEQDEFVIVVAEKLIWLMEAIRGDKNDDK